MYNSIRKYSADMVICGLIQCYQNNKIPRKIVEKESCYTLNDIENFHMENFDVNASSVNKMYKRTLLSEKERYPEDLFMAEDLVFNRKIFLKCDKIVLIPDLLYMNRQRLSSACHQVIDKKRIDNYFLAANKLDLYELSVTNKERVIAWNNIPSLLILSLLQSVIFQKIDNSKEYLKYLVGHRDFWKFINRLHYNDFKRNFKIILLRKILKFQLYSFCLFMTKTYAWIKKDVKINEGYL
jgi:hypothetical protein